MGRIVYFAFSDGGISGGHKMIFRHVEALRALGFDAVAYVGAANAVPTWFEHNAPVVVGEPVPPDDVLVVPNDAPRALGQALRLNQRTVIFIQAFQTLSGAPLAALEQFPPDRLPPFMAVAPRLAATVRRFWPQATAEVVPCFADERRFRPAGKQRGVAVIPRKRPAEFAIIRDAFAKLHPGQADLRWRELANASETEVAAAFAASSLHLALPRMEAVGLPSLEAMAAGCVCTGFLGVGGAEYATADNGVWAPEDDCEAAADALARADDLARTGGPALTHMLDAARATAAAWSYARFVEALEAFWMRHAPDARLKNGPLD